MKKDSRIYIAGHNGLVGSAIIRELKVNGYTNIINSSEEFKSKHKGVRYAYDLTNPSKVNELFREFKPEYVFLAAAMVGGILENDTKSAEMIYKNLAIQTNVIESAHRSNVKKLIFLGSSCIYPKFAKQPIKEEYFLTGELESTNIGYAVAKIAGITMCNMYQKQYNDKFISVMPTNLYGWGDNFNLESSHVLPALIRKFHDAKQNDLPIVELWGSGTPKREFLFVDDLAKALIFLMNEYDDKEILNIGTGEDISIADLAEIIKEIVGYKGAIIWDGSKPDGTPRKLLDVSNINNLGWVAGTPLKKGIEDTYNWFRDNYESTRK